MAEYLPHPAHVDADRWQGPYYQGGEGPLEQRRTSGGNGGVDAAHLPLGMSARGGANSPRVVYASGAENLGPPKANGHYHPSQAFLRWSSAAPAVPRRPCSPSAFRLRRQPRSHVRRPRPLMRFLVDTNILLRSAQPNHLLCPPAAHAVSYQGGEGPLEQRRTSGGNGGVDAAHLPLGMSARGGANSPRVVYASGAENLGPPKANGHYH